LGCARSQSRPARQDAFDVLCQPETFRDLGSPMVPESAYSRPMLARLEGR
jgi:hypothetical protein